MPILELFRNRDRPTEVFGKERGAICCAQAMTSPDALPGIALTLAMMLGIDVDSIGAITVVQNARRLWEDGDEVRIVPHDVCPWESGRHRSVRRPGPCFPIVAQQFSRIFSPFDELVHEGPLRTTPRLYRHLRGS